MIRFLEALSKEVDAVRLDSHAGSDTPADGRDHVVGVLPDELKALFVLRETAAKAVADIRVKLFHTVIDAAQAGDRAILDTEMAACKRPYSAAVERFELLNTIFWASIRDEFPDIADKSSIGVRGGWDVVWTEEEEVGAEPSDPLAGLARTLDLGDIHAHLIELAIPRRTGRRSRLDR